MLVLSRKVGEKVVVPDYRVTITVLSVQGGRVRLGISAPAETAVHREEVWRRGPACQGQTVPLASGS
jgi:carbon storage regulator